MYQYLLYRIMVTRPYWSHEITLLVHTDSEYLISVDSLIINRGSNTGSTQHTVQNSKMISIKIHSPNISAFSTYLYAKYMMKHKT